MPKATPRPDGLRAGERSVLAALLASLLASCGDCEGGGLSELIPLVTPSADSVDLGSVYVGAFADRTVTLRSSGTADLDVRSTTLDGSPAFTLISTGKGGLAPGASRDLVIRFIPTAARVETATLLVESDAENDPELRIAVTATGVTPDTCDDGNPCTGEVFDPALGQCVTSFVSGPCDDGSACTTSDVCLAGQCVGTALSCPASDICSRGVCDATSGCLSIPDPDACDDDNPCTLDRCDPATGCSHEAVVDGTPCAPLDGCLQAQVCLSGACTTVPVPNGFPCSDGDLCTTGDACQDGVCAGERVARDPEVVGSLHTFGAPRAQARVPGDGSVWFLDDGHVTVVDASSGALVPVAEGSGGARVAAWASLDAARALLLRWDPDAVYRAVVVERQPDGTLLELGQGSPFPNASFTDYITALGSTVYECLSSLQIIDVADVSAPAAVPNLELPGGGLCTALAVDEVNHKLYVGLSTGGLWTLDVSSPLSPVDEGLTFPDVLVAPIATDGTVLAVYQSDATSPPGSAAPPGSGGVLQLLDATTGAPLGQVPHATDEPVSGLGFADAGLVVTRHLANGSTLELWDVTAPATPVLRVSTSLSRATLLEPLVVRGDLVVLPGRDLSAAVFRIDPASPAFTPLRGNRLGGVSRVHASGGGVFTRDVDSVRAVTLASPQSPEVEAATVLPLAVQLVSFGEERSPPTHLTQISYPDALTSRFGTYLGAWADAAAPASARAVASARAPLGAFRAARSTGRSLYAAVTDNDGEAFALEVFDLEDVPDGFDALLVPAASLRVPFLEPPGQSDIFLSVAPDEASQQVAVAVNHHGTASVELALFDIVDPVAPALVAHSLVDGLVVYGAGLSSGRLVVTGTRQSTPDYQSYRATELVVFAPFASELVEVSSLSLPLEQEPGHVLAFDGRTAFVAARGGVLFVDVAQPEPVLLGEVDTAGAVVDSAFTQDHLVVTSRSALEVVSPPCPPPP